MMELNLLVGNLKKMANLSKINRGGIKKIFKRKKLRIGAGRTDKGVHAFGQFANFKNQ